MNVLLLVFKPCSIDTPKVYACGDVMYDNSIYFSKETDDSILSKHSLLKDSYILLTIHRPSNTDSSERLRKICSSLIALVEKQEEESSFSCAPKNV